MEIGEILREARKKNKKTLKEVAEEIGIDISTLQKYEKGTIKNIPQEKLVKLSTSLCIAPLFGPIGLFGSVKNINDLYKSINDNSKEMDNILLDIIFLFESDEISQEDKDDFFSEIQKVYFKNKFKREG